MKYQLAIFDMDGTILYTLEDLQLALNEALLKFDFPLRTLDEVRRFVGNGIRRLVERGVPDTATPEEIDGVYDRFHDYYAVHCADHTKPYDGIYDAITTLKKNGIHTAVVSNKADYAVQTLCHTYFDGLFESAVGSKDSIRKKPWPDSVNAVLDELHIGCEHAVYIGDTEVDMETAKNAHMDCISVDWGFRDRDNLVALGAHPLVSDANELLKAIGL